MGQLKEKANILLLIFQKQIIRIVSTTLAEHLTHNCKRNIVYVPMIMLLKCKVNIFLK